MLNRDFTKPKKDYILKNKLFLIVSVAIMIVGIVMLGAFGFNKSIDYTGCYMVSVNVGEDLSTKEFNSYEDKIIKIVNGTEGLDLYSVQIKGEGENTCLEIKYTGKLTDKKENQLNAGFVTELTVDSTEISEHEYLNKTVGSTEIIYTVVAILVVLLIAVIFALFRHNISFAISIMAGGFFAIFGLILSTAILRIQIEESYLMILILTIIYTLFETIILFESVRENSLKSENKKDFNSHLVKGFKQVNNRLKITAVALFIVGLILVLFGSNITRTIAINMMFAILMSLIAVSYVVPFVYNLTIDKVKIKKTITKKTENVKTVETKTKDNIKVVESKVVEKETQNYENSVSEKQNQEVEVDGIANKNEEQVESEVVKTQETKNSLTEDLMQDDSNKVDDKAE